MGVQSEEAKPAKKEESKPIKSEQLKPSKKAENDIEQKQEEKASKTANYPKVKMSEATLKSVQPNIARKSVKMLLNLKKLPSSDIRQILHNIGEPMIGELIFSNSIDGEQIYHYLAVNPLLQKFNVSFPDEAAYSSMVHQIELSYQKNGAINIYNTEKKKEEEKKAESKDKMEEQKDIDLKQNIPDLISSDVRLLVLPFNAELAERLYAFSIDGSDLYKLDYDGVLFATGMNKGALSKQSWNKIVKELKLPQSEPFDASKWQK